MWIKFPKMRGKNQEVTIKPIVCKNKTVKSQKCDVATSIRIPTESRAGGDRAGSRWLEMVIELTTVWLWCTNNSSALPICKSIHYIDHNEVLRLMAANTQSHWNHCHGSRTVGALTCKVGPGLFIYCWYRDNLWHKKT